MSFRWLAVLFLVSDITFSESGGQICSHWMCPLTRDVVSGSSLKHLEQSRNQASPSGSSFRVRIKCFHLISTCCTSAFSPLAHASEVWPFLAILTCGLSASRTFPRIIFLPIFGFSPKVFSCFSLAPTA